MTQTQFQGHNDLVRGKTGLARLLAVMNFRLAARAMLSASLVSSLLVLFDNGKIIAAEGSPAGLVKEALRSELDGPSEVRKARLDEALRVDSEFAPARWQSGFVHWQDAWLSVDEVTARTAQDKKLAAYRKMRDDLIETADNQRALALWCRNHKLADEERMHWTKVFEFDQDDAEAASGGWPAAIRGSPADARANNARETASRRTLASSAFLATEGRQMVP